MIAMEAQPFLVEITEEQARHARRPWKDVALGA